MAAKHPTAWVEFETDRITEEELFAKFFKDGREFDGPALVAHMVSHYRLLDGMEALLGALRAAGVEMHACSNYPSWHEHIERKLELSRFLDWTFVSCTGPMRGHRKPSPESYACAATHLGRPPSELLLVDDRLPNVEGARAAGLQAIHFRDAATLERELRQSGLVF